MRSYEGIARNFRFMVVQVHKQLENTLSMLETREPRLARTIRNNDDFIDNQKSMIENDCFELISAQETLRSESVDSIRAMIVVTSNLERIADKSVNIARQVIHLGDSDLVRHYDYRAYFDLLLEGIDLIDEALLGRDSALALRICKIEERLDRLYRADLARIIVAIRSSPDTDKLITVLFILHYLERMGDALLNVGEAIILAAMGERLKIRQYRVLDAALETPITSLEVDSIWGTRSGARVGTLERENGDKKRDKMLFKEGASEKLSEEMAALKRWNELAPGIAPEVVEYEQKGSGAALILQYIDGATFQDVALNGELAVVRQARSKVQETLTDLWTRTRRDDPVSAGFMNQLSKRLADVRRLHADLLDRRFEMGEIKEPSLRDLVERAVELEADLQAPFTVFIHGDLNLDNIIYNAEADTLHVVDVHRSREMDYVQDVSVFLVSSFRLPVFSPGVRRRLEAVAFNFLKFVRGFAASQGDESFEARLTLGLVRSLTTSTRFEINREFAETMVHRAVFLLSKLLEHRGKEWASYRTPEGILAY